MPTTSPALAPTLKLSKPVPTPAQLAHRAKLKEYGRKGGLARKVKTEQLKHDESQVHEIVREHWSDASVLMIREALKAARNDKTDAKQLVGKFTAAAIAFDKRWSKTAADTSEVAMPASLVSEIAKACTGVAAKPAIHNDVAVLGQVRDMAEADPDAAAPAIDPAALDPGG